MRTIVSLAIIALLLVPAIGRADEQADVQKLIEKAAKALGERAGRHQASALKMSGKFYGVGEGIDFTAEFKTQDPGQSRADIAIEVAGSKIEILQVVNGDKGWKSTAGNIEDTSKEELDEQKEGMYAEKVARLTVLKEKGYKLLSLGEKKVGDRVAVGVKVSHDGHRDVSLYLDKESDLLLASERRVKNVMANQQFAQETPYGDYKDVNGRKQAHKLTINHDGKRFIEGDISDFKNLEELDASTFAKP